MRLYAKFTKQPLSTFDKVNNKSTNITLLQENDIEKTPFAPSEYKNKGGNCALISICDLLNYEEETNEYIPTPRNKYNDKQYRKLVDTINSITNYGKTLKELSSDKYTGYVMISCDKGYHAIAMINGMILNNWYNRELQTIEEFKKDMNYKRTPKVHLYANINSIISIKDKLIKAIYRMKMLNLGE